MRTLTLLATLFAVSALSAEEESPEQRWFYRGGGLTATNENSLGRAGEVVTYTLSTPDQVESVVKWYGDRFGLPQNHTLMRAADARFASLENDLHGTWQVYRDTDKQQHATLVTAEASTEHAHVTFYRRLELDSLHSVTVSISRTRKGTSIVVIYPRPLPGGQAKPAAAKVQAGSLPGAPAGASVQAVIMAVSAEDQLVEISVGAEDGLQLKERLIVWRGNQRIGEIEVTKLHSDKSLARITKGTLTVPLKAGDQVRAKQNTDSHLHNQESPSDPSSEPGQKPRGKMRDKPLLTEHARADEPPAAKRWPLEGELKVHPKYLYRYYVVFGDGQKCALYGPDHRRDIKQLAGVEPGSRVRVQGVLGTESFPGGTADNPSPFGPAWVLYMDVHEAEIVAKVRKAAQPAP